MEAVFDSPMRAHRFGEALGIGRPAADVEAVLTGFPAIDATLGLDQRKGFQIRPLLGLG